MLRLFIAVSRLFYKVGTHIELGSVGIVYGMSLECHPTDSTPMICEHMIPPNFLCRFLKIVLLPPHLRCMG